MELTLSFLEKKTSLNKEKTIVRQKTSSLKIKDFQAFKF